MKFLILLLAACSCNPLTTNGTTQALVDPATPWVMTTISNAYAGADGVNAADVNADGRMDFVVPWEQGTTVTAHISQPGGTWSTVVLGSGNLYAGVEDAIWADVDGDGLMDAVSAVSTNRKLIVHFANVNGTYTNLTIDTNRFRYMQLAYAGGRVYVGGYSAGAAIGYLTSPTPRTAGTWTYTQIGLASWIMSLQLHDMDNDGDLDVVVSDRDYIHSTPPNYTLTGERWLENPTWNNQPIGPLLSGHKFLDVRDLNGDGYLDVTGGRSSATYNQIFIKTRDVAGVWITAALDVPSAFGLYHDVTYGDIDQDGVLDRVFASSSAGVTLSGIVGVSGRDGTRWEISGTIGEKFDNVELVDVDADGYLDVVTSEQNAGLGLVWYRNPYAVTPGIDAGVPDGNYTCLCEP